MAMFDLFNMNLEPETVHEEALESVEIMPDGEIRARWAQIVSQGAGPRPNWRRASWAPGNQIDDPDVIAWIEAGKAKVATTKEHGAAEFLRTLREE